MNKQQIKQIIEKNELINHQNLIKFINDNKHKYDFNSLSRIIELSNSKRNHYAAFYTHKLF
ncbi:hypothetical protein ACR82Z_02140 [Mycoplasma sp. 6243]|uniref:hypothetical protein n=1 Tax=Mycoplasma sp. 6243 TaxID=3440865 RepID=UPI003EBA77D9